MDVTKLAYEPINEKYSKAKYLGIECIMDMTNGYINATKFCASAGDGKRFDNYLRLDRCKELIKCLKDDLLLINEEMKITVTGGQNGDLRGTYVHPDLLLDLSSWLSPSAYYKASQIVKNFLVREREDQIRLLTNDKCRLEKMFEESERRRQESEKRAEKMLMEMKQQNEMTHSKLDITQDTLIETKNTLEETKNTLDETKNTLDETKNTLEETKNTLEDTKDTLDRVEARVDVLVQEVVPPAKQVSLHEQFGILKLNDPTKKRQYKVYCAQKRCVEKAKDSIKKEYPNATLLIEISPSPNSKNFLHKLKDLYGRGKQSKIETNYNYINLKEGVSENQFIQYVNQVVENAKSFGN